jgi:zinc D-Ala-D-Ala carboxypeptidase
MDRKLAPITIIIVAFFAAITPLFTYSIPDTTQEIQTALMHTQYVNAEKTYLLGKFDPATEPGFVPVPAPLGISGYQMYLRAETLNAFELMEDAAEKDGIKLRLASTTRNFAYQANLWNTKWQSFSKTIPDGATIFQTILEYSAAPGTSRHHWGTDIDLNAATPEYFETEQGQAVYAWLTANAPSFGFCQPYNEKGADGKDRTKGYNEEKWHWTYLPLSREFTQEYKNLITDSDITGFDGDQYAPQFDLINNYVLSINPECL